MAARLRAVAPDEKATKPQTVAEAAATGSRLDLLIAMRDRIARTVSSPDCPPRDLASLTRRLSDVSREIDGLRTQLRQEADEAAATSDDVWSEEAL